MLAVEVYETNSDLDARSSGIEEGKVDGGTSLDVSVNLIAADKTFVDLLEDVGEKFLPASEIFPSPLLILAQTGKDKRH